MNDENEILVTKVNSQALFPLKLCGPGLSTAEFHYLALPQESTFVAQNYLQQ